MHIIRIVTDHFQQTVVKFSPSFFSLQLQTINVSSTKEIPVISFYSSRKRIDHELIVTNGQMAKKSKPQPEIICLSDDDSDNNNKTNVPVVTPVKQQSFTTVNGTSKNDTSQISDWTIHRKDIIRIPELPIKLSELIKKPLELSCSAVSFGVVEFNVELDMIHMKEAEIEFKLKCNFMDNLNIKLAYSDILSFYFSFQSQPPAAFIQVRPDFAELFAKYIESTDEHGKQFDPNSKDERRRRIVLCLKHVAPDTEKTNIASIYCYLKSKSSTMSICCVGGSKAQELYNLSRFGKVSALGSITTPFIISADELSSKTVGLNNKTIRFDLSRDDLMCLNEGEFLNDNIIDFYLQYVYYEKLSEEDRKRTYLFNSFFYTRLTRKGNDDIPNISGERRYNRVKRWLRDVDIFSKDYLIVPINQTAHWYIVLIQFHNNVPTEGDLISDDDDDVKKKQDNRLNSKKKKTNEHVIQPTISNNCTEAESPSSKSNIYPVEILDEADEITADNENQTNTNNESDVNHKNRSQTPAIIIFDSLRAGSKTRVAATLREFLQLEYDHKKPLPIGSSARKIFNLDTIPTIEAAVPQQPNYFDCGLFILQYIESFFAHRSPTINLQCSSTFANWCENNSMGSSKRKEIFKIINQHILPKEE